MRTVCCLLWAFMASGAWGSFKCVDAQGRTHVGDSPPAACADALTFEVSSSGAVIRRIEPSPSGGSAAPAGADKRAADNAVAAKRRDRALLDSYTSADEIDRARDRSLVMLRGRIDATSLRMSQLAKSPTRNTEAARTEEASLAASKARFEKEYEETRARFESDKARWLELRAAR